MKNEDEKKLFNDLRFYLKRHFNASSQEDSTEIDEISRILLSKDHSNPHLRFLAAHVLWHVVVDCGFDVKQVFGCRSQFPYLDGQQYIISSKLREKPFEFVDLSILNGLTNVLSTNFDQHVDLLVELVEFLLETAVPLRPIDNFCHFTVLKNFLAKFVKAEFSFENPKFHPKYETFKKYTFRLIESYWDNRFSGVAELSLDIFGDFLLISSKFVESGKLIENYLRNFPFFVRGKYKAIAVLVEHSNWTEFQKYEDILLTSLRHPLASTYLAPSIGTVYKTVLKFLSLNDARKIYVDRWISWTIESVCSPKRILALNTSKNCLPAVAKYLPSSYGRVKSAVRQNLATFDDRPVNLFEFVDVSKLTCLDDGESAKWSNVGGELRFEQIQWANAVVLRYALRVKELHFTISDSEFLSIGLRSVDSEVRIECFQVFSDPIAFNFGTFIDDEILADFVLNNLTVADSSFRRRLYFSFRKWAKFRLDANKKAKNSSFFDFFQSFFVKLCSNIFPSAVYQRLASALCLIEIILTEAKNFADQLNLSVLISSELPNFARCLQNSSNDIRETTERILNAAFADFDVKDEFSANLIEIAKSLSDSPKELDCEAGSSVWKFIFERHFFDKKRTICLNNEFRLKWSTDSTSVFVAFLRFRFDELKKNLTSAALENPLHGFLLCCGTFLDVFTRNGFQLDVTCAEAVFAICDEISDYFLKIFGSSNEGECPSLEDMENAVAAECSTETEENMVECLPLDKQLVLACCWLNIKDSAGVAAKLAQCKFASETFSLDILTRIGELFFRMMTRTRHWVKIICIFSFIIFDSIVVFFSFYGVLEGASEALSAFCHFCCKSDSQAREIPTNLLHKIFDHVANPRSVSITRRAVGYPMMIQCILIESKPEVLRWTFTFLLNLAKKPVDDKLDGKSDVAVVRAVHCLRLLLRCSKLGLEVLPFLTDCYRLVLQFFCSPLWPLRNSAVMTLAALIWRLFGRRKIVGDGEEVEDVEDSTTSDICTSLTEFRANFDEIWQICVATLNDVVEKAKSSGNKALDQRLYPVLAVLQNLCLVDDQFLDLDPVRKVREDLIYLLRNSPDRRLRRVAVDAFVNFLTPGEKCSLFDKILAENCQFSTGNDQMSTNSKQLPLNQVETLIFLAKRLKISETTMENVEIPKSECDLQRIFVSDPVHTPMTCNSCLVQLYGELRRNSTFLTKKCTASSDFNRIRHFLLECCRRTFGFSAQSLALPLLAHLDVDHAEVLYFVEECCEEKRSETCRFAAAFSLMFFGKSANVSQEIRRRLFSRVLHLLLDEDEEIRQAASRFFVSVAQKCPSLNVYLCLQKLFDEIELDELELIRQVFQLLLVKSDEFSTPNGRKSKSLFEQKDFNIFREEFLLVQLSFRTFKRLQFEDSDLVLKIGQGYSAAMVHEDVSKFLKNCEGVEVFSATNAESCFIPAAKLRFLVEIFNVDHSNSEIRRFCDFCWKSFGSTLNCWKE